MFNLKRTIIFVMTVMALCTGFAKVSLAGEDVTGDLASFTCKDIMRYSGEDREISIGVLHGYLLGKKGTTVYNSTKLAEATDQFIEYCLDNPKAGALESMAKFVK